jgi:hypothetical protein
MNPHEIICPNCGTLAATITQPPREVPPEPSLLGDFLRENCTLTPGARVSTGDFLEAFRSWVKTTVHIDPPSAKLVGTDLRALGIEVSRSNGARYYTGVQLKASAKSDPA